MRGTGNGDVCEACVDDFGVRGGLHVDQHAACGESLRAVGGHGIAVVEVTHLRGVEGDVARLVAVHLHAELCAFNLRDYSKVSVRNSQFMADSGELNPVPLGELA